MCLQHVINHRETRHSFAISRSFEAFKKNPTLIPCEPVIGARSWQSRSYEHLAWHIDAARAFLKDAREPYTNQGAAGEPVLVADPEIFAETESRFSLAASLLMTQS